MGNYKTLEFVNQFYFKGSILEFYQGALSYNLLESLSKGVLGHASQPEVRRFPMLLSQPEMRYSHTTTWEISAI